MDETLVTKMAPNEHFSDEKVPNTQNFGFNRIANVKNEKNLYLLKTYRIDGDLRFTQFRYICSNEWNYGSKCG